MRIPSRHISTLLFLGLIAHSCLPASAVVRMSDLGPLELRFFSHQYERETPTERLDRLEKLVFGSVQSGSIEERVANISKTVVSAAPANQAIGRGAPQPSSSSGSSNGPSTGRSTGSSDAPKPQSNSSDANTSDYPRVSELERSLLGRTYVGEPVRQRLSRLELKAYGAPSRIDDLATRVDKLSSYADVYGMQAGDSTSLGSADLRGSAGMYGQPQSRSNGMLDKVSAMEIKVFGRASNHSLVQRIKELEGKVIGNVASNPDEDMTTRVNSLWAKVQLDNTHVASGSGTAQSLSSYSGFYGQQTASQPQPAASTPFAALQGNKRGNTYNSNSAYNSNNSYNSNSAYNSYNSNNSYNSSNSFNSNNSYNSYNSQGSSGNSYSSPYGSSNYAQSGNSNSSSSNSSFSGAYGNGPFMANNGTSNSQFGNLKSKHKNKGQHGSFLGKIGKVVVFAGSAAIGAGGMAVGAMSSMNGGYYGMGMGSGFGSPYSYSNYAPGYSSVSSYPTYGSVSTIGSFGSMSSAFGAPFASSYAGSFFSP